ncbi:inositol polyphosphate kinase family protein [Streptomyces sp.]|uniref:inositol polyphosphate kinase family protein n=1 Tax=Streptomyces sp. TaxID=1931 RepID=UPI002D790507|nr:inositol polyphosphate kinase family protein [Streptomyces sp.]HET6358871.1 inositol polyphosphate kinase family protein [Streptomyces sp.]
MAFEYAPTPKPENGKPDRTRVTVRRQSQHVRPTPVSDEQRAGGLGTFEGQVAGHGGIEALPGGVLRKPTNQVERGLFAAMRTGGLSELASVTPKSYGEDAPQLIGSSQEGRESSIFIENLTHNMLRPKILDVKIGHRAASRRELLKHGGLDPWGAWWKKMRLTLADLATTSGWLGYGVVGGTGVMGTRIEKGIRSGQHLEGFSGRWDVYKALEHRLEEIRSAVRKSCMAPLGASVLIAVDEGDSDPASTVRVKLIDLAHTFGPELLGEEARDKYQRRFEEGVSNLINAVGKIGRRKKSGRLQAWAAPDSVHSE